MSTLFIDRLSKQYEKQRWALKNVSLRLDSGIVGLVGPNGSGKTTLLRILATLLTPNCGKVHWKGQDIQKRPQLLRRELGYLPQDFGIYPQLTAREFLTYIGELKGLSGQHLRRRIEAVLEQVNLREDANRRLRTYSGGMVRRIGIAQALLNDPHLLVLDEPTVGLDPAERVHFREIISSLSDERLILLSTHIISDIEVMANEMVLLQQGHLIWSGTTNALLNDATESVWSLTLDAADYERLRLHYRTSLALRRGRTVEMRLISAVSPHPNAIPVEPTLEEAYLFVTQQATAEESVAIK
ncbi:ABC transporter ATP-binding protein [Ktedonobacter sp. SOSP1-52]|uniref:ABC transporter ATP-binding protein n=1 Tax=Ktedonobacter sp. SOSP1-52 TaxID=2778366 RepID=UPI00191523E0|nr:ABC transporter ATP-binding protein [Ktedonobacter sp. SOSP1-52]GHO63439.1 ABC transporter ATP-binding protein [Ktedonobacter sp. SOSP1-52]